MELSKQLILFRYILRQFGYEEFEVLREEFNNREQGVSATGYTYFAGMLMSNSGKLIDDRIIQGYDEAIRQYEKRLRENRAEPFFSFKYYQWFALLFTEFFFDVYHNNKDQLINGLNEYLEADSNFREVEKFTGDDLKKLAYWMATGSGKTLLMHCNYWQIIRYNKNWENIILITPNEGLSRQHYESLTESGIPAKLYSGSEESLKTKEGEILILEITKLVKNKEGEGVSVDVDYFSESRNLVFIDEGHKGSKSEEQTWKSLREYLTRGKDSFRFEYSATFGQVITSKNKFLLNEYAKSIIFDYSYRHFYTDGYGKDFSVLNIDVKNDYSEDQNWLLLSASLLGYYEQQELFDRYRDELREYNIEKPLWVFVGSRVIGSGSKSLTADDKMSISDVTRIIGFFKEVLSEPAGLQRTIDEILAENTGFRDTNGDDIFKHRFEYLRSKKPKAELILEKVFNGIGKIEAWQIKQAEGEIGLKTTTSEKYFAVINIGDVPKYAKTLEADTGGDLTVQDDAFTRSLFQSISESDSPVKILIGSKKFIEGWNSWRVSSMGLMNMGKSEGAQIIQLFGRGVRLKGKGLSLKREEKNSHYYLRALQTIFVMGLNASYMNRFLSEIEKEVPDYSEFSIEIRLNNEEKWNGKLLSFKKEKEKEFKSLLTVLSFSNEIAKKITVDLRNRIMIAESGFNNQLAEERETYSDNFLHTYTGFLDFDDMLLEANRFKLLKGYSNLLIFRETLEQILLEGNVTIYSHKGQFGLEDAISGRIQGIALNIVKEYINKFYADQEKRFLSEFLTYDMLDTETHNSLFPSNRQLIIRVPGKHNSVIKELKDSICEFYNKDNKVLPSLHFDKHLYSPIAIIAGGEKYREIKIVPARLNEGETLFLKHLREFVAESGIFSGREVFILRNLSMKGFGFFMESSSFYPDFIIWVVDGVNQYIYFLDPKGILLGETHFNNPKVLWCRDDVRELEQKIREDLEKNSTGINAIISAYILSITPFDKVSGIWSDGGVKREDFSRNRILFIENDKGYLKEIFSNLPV
jgi:hypothetical protein